MRRGGGERGGRREKVRERRVKRDGERRESEGITPGRVVCCRQHGCLELGGQTGMVRKKTMMKTF